MIIIITRWLLLLLTITRRTKIRRNCQNTFLSRVYSDALNCEPCLQSSNNKNNNALISMQICRFRISWFDNIQSHLAEEINWWIKYECDWNLHEGKYRMEECADSHKQVALITTWLWCRRLCWGQKPNIYEEKKRWEVGDGGNKTLHQSKSNRWFMDHLQWKCQLWSN